MKTDPRSDPRRIAPKYPKTTLDSYLWKARNQALSALYFLLPTTWDSQQGVKPTTYERDPDPRCGAVLTAGGRQSDHLLLSCSFFDPPVHLPLSVVLNSLDGAHRPHAFDMAASAVSGGCYPPDSREATQRRTGCHAELPLFLNAETVAKVLSVSLSSGYELMHEPNFPVLKIGSRIVVPKEKFVEWVSQHTRGGAD